MAEQRHIVFHGHVQGVGFRWTASRLARDQGVVGWVRNNPDGTVEMVAEAESADLDAFLERLRSNLGGHIRQERSQTAPASGSYTGFEIRH